MDATRNKKILGSPHPPPRAQAEQSEAGGGRKTVTRADLLDAVYNACPTLSRAQARDLFEMTLEEIVGSLLRDESVKLRSFGAFNVRAKRERIGRNPRNGVEATIDARRVLTFKASPTLTSRVNGWAAPEDEED
jgi:integration host factor subunit alpha